MRIAGYNTVKVSEQNVHPGAEAERAFERLEAFDKEAVVTEDDEGLRLHSAAFATLEELTPAGGQEIALIQ